MDTVKVGDVVDVNAWPRPYAGFSWRGRVVALIDAGVVVTMPGRTDRLVRRDEIMGRHRMTSSYRPVTSDRTVPRGG